MSGSLVYLVVVALLGAGLVAGIFFAFSTFVMRALGQLPASQGIAAMQAINVTVINPWFLLPFFATGVVCLAIAWLAATSAVDARVCLLVGSAFYVLGCVGVTMFLNVPWNNRLASIDPGSPGAAALWAQYPSRWTLWNHVRTGASLAAAALLAWGLFCGRGNTA